MAQLVKVLLLDDTDPTGETPADETVQFALDGIQMEIDVSSENAEAIRSALEPFIEHARRVGGRAVRGTATKSTTRRSSTDRDLDDVRAWARESGFQVSDRGRISGEVLEAYDNRNRAPKPVEPEPVADEAPVEKKSRGARKAAQPEFTAAAV